MSDSSFSSLIDDSRFDNITKLALAVHRQTIAFEQQTQSFEKGLAGMTRALEKLSERVEDVDRRLVRVEAATHEKEINRLEAAIGQLQIETAAKAGKFQDRLDALESYRDRVEGAGAFVGWVQRFGPWALGLAGAVGGWLGFTRLGP